MRKENVFQSNKSRLFRSISFILMFLLLFNGQVLANSDISPTSTTASETVAETVYGEDIIDSGVNMLGAAQDNLERISRHLSLRVEGIGGNIFSGEVEVETIGSIPTALDALSQALSNARIAYEIKEGTYGLYIESINGEISGMLGGYDGWMFLVNNETAAVGAGEYIIQGGEEIVFYYGMFPPDTLIPIVSIEPANPQVGQEIRVKVTSSYEDYSNWPDVEIKLMAVEGAKVVFKDKVYFTDDAGEAVIPAIDVTTTGSYSIRVSKDVANSYPLLVRTGDIPITVGEGSSVPQVNKTALTNAIGEAEKLISNAVVGENPGNYPQAAVNQLQTVLNHATTVINSETITQAEVDAAVAALNQAISTFREKVIPGALPELEKLVEDIVSYYKNNRRELTSWWELVALKGAGENLKDAVWTLPQWQSADFSTDKSPTDYAGRIMGLLAIGENPENWQGRNLVDELRNKQNATDGSFGSINNHIYAMLALDAAQASYDKNKAVGHLLSKQLNNGGFSLSTTADSDVTAMALSVLGQHKGMTGVDTGIQRAISYLKTAQLNSGGFASIFTSMGSENANSSAMVISSLVAVGENITGDSWMKNGKTPLHALISYKKEDHSFAFLPEGGTNQAATQQALIAIGDLLANEPVYWRLKEKQVSDNADLLDLRCSTGFLSPSFSSKTYQYTLYIGSDVSEITINPIKANTNAIMSINNKTVSDAFEKIEVPKEYPEENVIEIKIVAEDGTAINTYTVKVIRAKKVTIGENAAETIELSANEPVNILLDNTTATNFMKITELQNHSITLPFVQVNANSSIGNIEVVFPKNLQVTGTSNWDGSIQLPKVVSNQEVSISNGTVNAVVEIGFPAGRLEFDQGVRIVMPEQAGKSAAFVSANNSPVEIVTTLSEDTQAAANALPAGGIAKIDVDDDLVIWTKHFTKFIAYTSSNTGGGSGGNPVSDEIKVRVEIVGKNNKNHYSGGITLSKDKANPFEALKATGVSYRARDNNAYIEEIAGEKEDGTSTAGWKYKVGSIIPGIPATEYTLKDGDHLLWFWAEDYTSTSPGGGGAAATTQGEILLSKEIEESIMGAIKKLEEASKHKNFVKSIPIEELEATSIVIGKDQPMTESQRKALQSLLEENIVAITQKVEARKESIVTDEKNEIILKITKDAISKEEEITVKEMEKKENIVLPSTHQFLSSIYAFGPKGLIFNKPMYISIRVAIPEDVSYEDIVLARYHEDEEQWVALATVVDASTGTITGLVEDFSKFSVLVRKDATEELQEEEEEKAVLISFQDVDEENYSWAIKEIKYLVEKGVIKGVGDHRFEPARAVNRAEFTTLLVKVLGLDDNISYQGRFQDVREEDWYAIHVQAALEAGIISGLTENTFAPYDKLTREQAAVMMSKILGEREAIGTTIFKDNHQIASWAIDRVAQVVDRGIFRGFPDETFRSKEYVTRAESAVLIYKFLREREQSTIL
ncbi:S-layer homology domain-containing protein [Clostridium formicaceticum]|nr:S-layer homology domain-containing protein [Clostridium formicaceticum]